MTEPEISDRLAATVAKYAHTTATDQRANDQARDIPDWQQLRATWARDFGEDY